MSDIASLLRCPQKPASSCYVKPSAPTACPPPPASPPACSPPTSAPATIMESLEWAIRTSTYASNLVDFAALSSKVAHEKSVASSNVLYANVANWHFGSNMSMALFNSSDYWDWASNQHSGGLVYASPAAGAADTSALYTLVSTSPIQAFDDGVLGWTAKDNEALPRSTGQLLATLYGAVQEMQKAMEAQSQVIDQMSCHLARVHEIIGL